MHVKKLVPKVKGLACQGGRIHAGGTKRLNSGIAVVVAALLFGPLVTTDGEMVFLNAVGLGLGALLLRRFISNCSGSVREGCGDPRFPAAFYDQAAVCRTPIHLGEVIVPYKTRYKEASMHVKELVQRSLAVKPGGFIGGGGRQRTGFGVPQNGRSDREAGSERDGRNRQGGTQRQPKANLWPVGRSNTKRRRTCGLG